MTAKEKHKIKLLEYLGDPENDFPNRSEMAKSVLGYKQIKSMYRIFTTQEMTEIENEAWEIRKGKTTKQRAEVYSALHKRAIGYSHKDVHISNYQGDITITDITKHYPPDPVSAREFLDRTEGKVKEEYEHLVKTGGVLIAPAAVDENGWINAAKVNQSQVIQEDEE